MNKPEASLAGIGVSLCRECGDIRFEVDSTCWAIWTARMMELFFVRTVCLSVRSEPGQLCHSILMNPPQTSGLNNVFAN